jgi:ATP synthase protein I
VKLLPRKRTNTDSLGRGDTLGRGMDLALVTLVFLGIGYGLDRWFGTRPVLMIVMVVLSTVGQFVKMWFDYDSTMKVLEAERAHGSRSGQMVGAATDARHTNGQHA